VRGYTPEVFDGHLVAGLAVPADELFEGVEPSGLGSRDELGIVG
jgi:hypothetical protein